MKEKNKRTDMGSLSLRLIAGVYLLYTDYSLFKEWENVEQGNRIFIALAIIFFAVAGVLLTVFSARDMIRLNKLPDDTEKNDDAGFTEDKSEEDNDQEIDGAIKASQQESAAEEAEETDGQ